MGLMLGVSAQRAGAVARSGSGAMYRDAGGLSISGVVVDGAARPIAGALVAITSGDHSDIAAISGSDGSFRLPVPAPGSYVVTAQVKRGSRSVVVAVEEGAPSFVIIEIP